MYLRIEKHYYYYKFKNKEEIKSIISIKICFYRLTSQALEYQRTYRDADNMEDLLHHLFLGCQQSNFYFCTVFSIHLFIILLLLISVI